MSKTREPGQYWVRHKGTPGVWTVALWDPIEKWHMPQWRIQSFTDPNMEEIDETPITRDTKTQNKKSGYAGFNKDTAAVIGMQDTREAILQLSHQVERIANVLEKQNELIDLTKMWHDSKNKEEFLDKMVALMASHEPVFGSLPQQQYTKHTDPVVQYLQKQKKVPVYFITKTGGRALRGLDGIYRLSGLSGRVIGWTEQAARDAGFTPVFEEGLDPIDSQKKYDASAYALKVDKDHPDYKGDLGAATVQKSPVQTEGLTEVARYHGHPTGSVDPGYEGTHTAIQKQWNLWEFELPIRSFTISFNYPWIVKERLEYSTLLLTWLPDDVNLQDVWPGHYPCLASIIRTAPEPVFDDIFPKPNWWTN